MKLSDELKMWGYHSSLSKKGKEQHLEMSVKAAKLEDQLGHNQHELMVSGDRLGRIKQLKAINAKLLRACNDALFVLQNKSYANTPSVTATLTDILAEAIRKGD